MVEVAGIEPASRDETQRSLQAYPDIYLTSELSPGRTAPKRVSLVSRILSDETRRQNASPILSRFHPIGRQTERVTALSRQRHFCIGECVRPIFIKGALRPTPCLLPDEFAIPVEPISPPYQRTIFYKKFTALT